MASLRLLLPLIALLLGTRANAQSGLKGEYYAGTRFERKAFTRIDPTVQFRWGGRPPGPGLDWQYYSVRWTGKLYAPTTGLYRFSVEVDDGVRVWVGGRKIIDAWSLHDNAVLRGSIALRAGRSYDLRVDYYNAQLTGDIVLYWLRPTDVSHQFSLTGFAIEPRYLTPPTNVVNRPAVARKPVTAPKSRATAATNGLAGPRLAGPRLARPKPTATAPNTPAATPTRPAEPAAVFEKLRPNEAVVLRNVFFQQSTYTLLPESYAELDKLVRTLRQQPSLRIQLVGHTDNIGDARRNQTLSEYRANVVASYLIRNGIDARRLETRGYGGTHPIADNATESARAQNRRVEFIVR